MQALCSMPRFKLHDAIGEARRGARRCAHAMTTKSTAQVENAPETARRDAKAAKTVNVRNAGVVLDAEVQAARCDRGGSAWSTALRARNDNEIDGASRKRTRNSKARRQSSENGKRS